MRRRTFLTMAGGAGLAAALPDTVSAQSAAEFPSKPINFIVPWPAGSGVDLFHRAHCEAASKILGQPIVVDNKAGGSGTSGPATMALTAKPDGYTISQIPITLFRLPHMQKVAFDPARDFSYIMLVSGYTFGVVVRADSPFKTFADLVEFARGNPGKMTYATPGAGTSLHVGMEQIALQAGVKFTHVPFKGGPEGWAALEGGHVMADADATGWAPLVDSGKFRLLVLWTEKRSARWPEVPTLREAGYNFVIDSPIGIGGPKGMDPAIVRKLHDAFKAAMDDPKLIDIGKKYDYPVRYMDTAAYNKFVIDEIALQKDLVEKLGLAKKDS